jgi:hypothetical protein
MCASVHEIKINVSFRFVLNSKLMKILLCSFYRFKSLEASTSELCSVGTELKQSTRFAASGQVALMYSKVLCDNVTRADYYALNGFL